MLDYKYVLPNYLTGHFYGYFVIVLDSETYWDLPIGE